MTIETGTTDRTAGVDASDRAILLVVCLVALLGFAGVLTMTG